MFFLELLPTDVLFSIALLLNIADSATLICVLTSTHQQVVIDAFESCFLRSILSHGNGGCAIWFNAWGPSIRAPLLDRHQNRFVLSSCSQSAGPITIRISPTIPAAPFFVDNASRFAIHINIEQSNYQYIHLPFNSTRAPADPTYASTEYDTGQRSYKITMTNDTNRNRPFRQFLADQMDVYIYTQDAGDTGEKQIMWVEFAFFTLCLVFIGACILTFII
jgi:hypothetical protein